MSDKFRLMYHTQEKRGLDLTQPIICIRDDAWLGDGYYFWDDEDDAIRWGTSSKKRTGRYQIYTADIATDNVLNTVFNEDHYRLWLRLVEKAAKHFLKKTGLKPSIKDINDFFREKAEWDEVDGILFQDIPLNDTYTHVRSFYYRKRIQLVVYNLGIIRGFSLYSEAPCI
ncbi:MAG: hypothetical protein LAT57_02545 [Balneolales bacterium]|nr:hypothetical protein [Balneolales bacterium]